MRVYIVLMSLLFLKNVDAQFTPCDPAPELSLSGTPISLIYQFEDPLMPPEMCQGIVADNQRHEYIVPTLELEDKYISIISNQSSGVVINAWDKETNELVWQNTYNHTNTESERAYGVTYVKALGGDTLLLTGHRSWNTFDGFHLPRAVYGGMVSNRKISSTDGRLYNDDYKGDGYHIFADIMVYNNMEYPATIPESDIYHTISFVTPIVDSLGILMVQYYHDSISRKRYLNFPPYNESPDNGAPHTGLHVLGPAGDKVSNIGQYGPMITSDSTKNYLLKYYFDSDSTYISHTRIVEMDNWGNLIDHYEVSDQTNGDNLNFQWNAGTVDRLGGGLYKIDGLMLGAPAEYWRKGYKRYVIIDSYGNKIRENSHFDFDGLNPLFWRSKVLHNGNILHVFRPTINNNLYFYEEYDDGSYRKAGEIINNGDSYYNFWPRQIDQLSDGDIIVKNYMAIDSVWGNNNQNNYTHGGWGVMLKVESEDLGLQVSTEDIMEGTTDLRIYPNPAHEQIRIDHKESIFPLRVMVYDMTGRSVSEYNLRNQADAISIHNWTQGIYQLRAIDNQGTIHTGRFYKK